MAPLIFLRINSARQSRSEHKITMTQIKISIVTPNKNGAEFLERTINSVLNQAYTNLEYIIVDGASADESLSIIDKYRPQLSAVIREPDRSHADAINKGFRIATGEVMGWINSDDMLLPGCLAAVNEVFQQFNDVHWITGRATTMTERDVVYAVNSIRPWSWLRFLTGDYRHIQQESTFWRRNLWSDVGGQLSQDLPLASDFELWIRFFQKAHLFSVDVLLGSFRFRKGQQSVAFADRYSAECEAALRALWHAMPIELLSKYVSVLAKPYLLQPSFTFSAVSQELAACDAPIITVRHGPMTFERSDDPPFNFDGGAGWPVVQSFGKS